MTEPFKAAHDAFVHDLSERLDVDAGLAEVLEKASADYETHCAKLTLARVADELGCTRDQLDLWFARNVMTKMRITRARVHELGRQLDRVTDLFEKWAAEENEHRKAGEFGIAEGLHVAIEELRTAVHGKEDGR